jgi:F0F1-type ATP synthase membrane subunit a
MIVAFAGVGHLTATFRVIHAFIVSHAILIHYSKASQKKQKKKKKEGQVIISEIFTIFIAQRTSAASSHEGRLMAPYVLCFFSSEFSPVS